MDFGKALNEMRAGKKMQRKDSGAWRYCYICIVGGRVIGLRNEEGIMGEWDPDSDDLLADDWGLCEWGDLEDEQDIPVP